MSALFRGRVLEDVTSFRPTHIVSLIDPSIDDAKVPKFNDAEIFQRKFYDLDAPHPSPLTLADVSEIVEFVGAWAQQRKRGEDARLLVHCHMGASRSTAVALIALAILRGEGAEQGAFADLLSITTKPWPNSNVVRLADEALGRQGRLLAALTSYRDAYPNRLAAYRRLNARRGLA